MITLLPTKFHLPSAPEGFIARPQLLEKLDGRDAVVALIHQGLDREISMFDYPRDEAWLLNLRHRVNQRIRELSK